MNPCGYHQSMQQAIFPFPPPPNTRDCGKTVTICRSKQLWFRLHFWDVKTATWKVKIQLANPFLCSCDLKQLFTHTPCPSPPPPAELTRQQVQLGTTSKCHLIKNTPQITCGSCWTPAHSTLECQCECLPDPDGSRSIVWLSDLLKQRTHWWPCIVSS